MQSFFFSSLLAIASCFTAEISNFRHFTRNHFCGIHKLVILRWVNHQDSGKFCNLWILIETLWSSFFKKLNCDVIVWFTYLLNELILEMKPKDDPAFQAQKCPPELFQLRIHHFMPSFRTTAFPCVEDIGVMHRHEKPLLSSFSMFVFSE